MKDIIFDQYSRYQVCADVLQKLGIVKGSVLDVGSGEECILGQFLPLFDITYVDPLLALHPEREKNKIAGNVFARELDGLHFDTVFSIDTLEHVPQNQREHFIARISSLAKNSLIIANPCADVGDAVETDKWINDTYKTAFGQDYKWLDEHFKNELPSLSWILDELHSLGWKTQVIQNGHTPWLKELLTFVDCALEFSSGRQVVMELSNYFNKNLYQFDHMEPAYRQVIIATKESIPIISQKKITLQEKNMAQSHWDYIKNKLVPYSYVILNKELKDLTNLQQTLNNAISDVDSLQKINLIHQDKENKLEESLKLKDTEAEQLKSSLRDKESQLFKLQSSLHDKELQLLNLQPSLRDKESQLFNLQSSLRDKESQLFKLQSSLHDKELQLLTLQPSLENKESQISNMRYYIKEKEQEIANLQDAVANYQKTITDIHQSFVLRMLHKYDKTIGKIIPLKPKRFTKSAKVQQTVQEQKENVKTATLQTFNKKDIICFPIINWDFRYQRSQHLMSKFAEAGHRIFYLTVNLRKLDKAYEIKQIKDNIFQLEFNCGKFFDIYKDTFSKSDIDFIINSIESAQKELNLDAISFVQFPTWEPLVLELEKKYGYGIVFDCLDDFTGFSNVTKERKKEEKILIKESDMVIATSAYLLKKVLKESSKSLFLPNAGEYQHFSKNTENLLKDYKKPIIGYFGAIADWFDSDLIEHIVASRPNYTFVLIGHTFGSDIRKLQEFQNVHFLGERPYSELPKYLTGFDVCLIPFKNLSLIEATHPVKIYEYFAAGKPVVATKLTELLSMSNLCYLAGNKKDFLDKIDIAVKEQDQSLKNKRIEFAKNNTWQHRFEILHAELMCIKYLNLDHHS